MLLPVTALLLLAEPQPGAEAALMASPPAQFACGGRQLLARFGPGREGPVAIVDVGQGARVLPLSPWDGGEPQVRWSDGQRTLTWSPGVQLMWRDGETHLMCGRAHDHQH